MELEILLRRRHKRRNIIWSCIFLYTKKSHPLKIGGLSICLSGLFSVVYRTHFPDYGNLDLSRILHVIFDLLRDVKAKLASPVI